MEIPTPPEYQGLDQNVSPSIPQKNIYKILFFIFLGLFLIVSSVLVTLFFTQKTPEISKITEIEEQETTPTKMPVSEVTDIPTIPANKSTITPTSSSIPKDWKTFSSIELGFSFNYPNSWGEAEIRKEDYTNRTTDGALDGKSFQIYFKNHSAVTGHTKNYNSYVSDDYVGDKANLDVPDTFSIKAGNIYFTKKATVANQNTSIKTSLEYLPEASGAMIVSVTNLNGKTEYTGIEITTYYPILDKTIEPLYKDSGSNEVLENEAIKFITSLKDSTSINKEAQIIFDQYQTWLKSFKQI